MRKMKLKRLGIGALILALGNVGYGASVDHIQHYTPEYTANPAQNGAINPGTSAYYNPAGLMQLENGRYFQVGAQGAYGKQKQKNDGKTYEADSFDVIPNIMFVDKTDERAWYFTFGGLAGGAEMEYKNGVPTIGQIPGLIEGAGIPGAGITVGPDSEVRENWAEGSNTYIQATLGRAWFVTEKLSLSAAGRVIHGQRNLDVRAEGTIDGRIPNPIPGRDDIQVNVPISDWMEGERHAWGYGGQFGLNYAATEKLNIGMRYDTRVKMDFRTDSKSMDKDWGAGGINGGILENLYPEYFNKSRRDLPAILAVGTQYRVTDMWAVYTSANYYFNKDADMDREYKGNRTYDNGWEVAVGSEYWLNNKWAWLVGANYADTGANRDSYNDSEFALNSFMLGTGFKYMQNPTTMWTVSIANYWYDSAKGEGSAAYENVTYKKDYITGGISLTKKF
ncbi:outer membrane protein P1 [Propionigenium maris DSM 9537]|uniref:Outer membrane protein P1 n=2 Tax=Propionigenium TaxID=2332 RepID=A0A9W6LLM3_9FUSO|nr:outer membrane protein P1 [Propionigenium maris DSM 9537]